MSSLLEFSTEVAGHTKLLSLDDNAASKSPENGDIQVPEPVIIAPIFSSLAGTIVAAHAEDVTKGPKPQMFPEYGLLGHRVDSSERLPDVNSLMYANVTAPWSAFICGNQGSGKSHTLSCLLENSLVSPSPAGRLGSPLAGLVFHYDEFSAFSSAQACEAAYLSSNIPVRVLVSPTNFEAMKNIYTKLPGLGKAAGRLTVEPLYLPQNDLTISMMKTLMGVNNKKEQPLYIEVVMKILRDMALANQGRESFDYPTFRRRLDQEDFMNGQQIPLNMRLDVLESFFAPGVLKGQKKPQAKVRNTWKFDKGKLTIIDLSGPFVGPDDACALYTICISLFLKDRHEAGRILALDEAHKFLRATSAEAVGLTDTLLSIVRQQRHLGTRVIIATQEPTISPNLLDLCNVTIIHRFTSPAWFKAIKAHIAGAVTDDCKEGAGGADLFRQIVCLTTGEALLFCPTALLDICTLKPQRALEDPLLELLHEAKDDNVFNPIDHEAVQLGPSWARIRVRQRLTADGGRSIIIK